MKNYLEEYKEAGEDRSTRLELGSAFFILDKICSFDCDLVSSSIEQGLKREAKIYDSEVAGSNYNSGSGDRLTLH